jgi:hypothetical protein
VVYPGCEIEGLKVCSALAKITERHQGKPAAVGPHELWMPIFACSPSLCISRTKTAFMLEVRTGLFKWPLQLESPAPRCFIVPLETPHWHNFVLRLFALASLIASIH